MALVVVVVLLLLPILAVLFSAFRRRRSTNLPPSPPGAFPIVGHLHLLRPPVHHSLHSLAARLGPVFHLRLGSALCVVVSDADSARDVVKNHDIAIADRPSNFAARRLAYDTPGFAFGPYGPYWRFMKRLCVSKLLGARTVESLRSVRRAELLRLVKSLAGRTSAVDMSKELIRMTSASVTRMAANMSPAETELAMVLVKQVAEIVGEFNVSDFVGVCRGWDLQGIGRRVEVILRKFDDLLEKLIADKMTTSAPAAGRSKDLLDILLETAKDGDADMRLTRENIKGFLMDVFTAGSDTTAAVIEWVMAELINHPRAIRRLQEEIDAAVGSSERVVGEADLPSLPYLNAVIKETLRLHPPAPIAHRQSNKPISIAGYDVPAGAMVLFNLWSIGRDPKYWDEPEEFRPERFLAGGGGDGDAVDLRGQHFQLIPFGSGRRGCPGITLAMQVLPAAVAALVHCFDWEVPEDYAGEVGGKLRMEDTMGMVAARKYPLLVVPKPRLHPFPVALA